MIPLPIGIFGGTFDPVHIGHIKLATTIYKTCNLQKVLLLPCYQSPLKPPPLANPKDRLEMLRLASQKFTYLEIDDSETVNQTISYTITTLTSLRQKNIAIPLALIMGRDIFYNFATWHKWQEIINLVHLIIVDRLPLQTSSLPLPIANLLRQKQTTNVQELSEQMSGLIYCTNLDLPQISSANIRNLIQQNQNIDEFIPPEVQKYIKKRQLYKKLL